MGDGCWSMLAKVFGFLTALESMLIRRTLAMLMRPQQKLPYIRRSKEKTKNRQKTKG